MCIRDRFPNFILLPTSKKSSTSTPDLAVITPIESTFLTSSYVKTPPTVTLPEKFAVDPDIAPVKDETPATVIPAFISTGYVLNVAAVPVIILSVDAIPVSPAPSPTKDTAVIIPVDFIL